MKSILKLKYNKYLKNIFDKDHFNNELNNFFKLTLKNFSSSIFLFDDEGNTFFLW